MSPRTQDKRTWLVGGAAASVAVAAAGWFLGVSPVLSDADSLTAQTASVHQQNAIAQAKIKQLADTQNRLPSLQRQLAAALAALPMDNGLPNFTRQLAQQAATFGLRLTAVTVGSFSAATGSSGTAAPAAADPAAAAGGAAAPANPTVASSGPVGIEVTVDTSGPAAAQLAFVRAIRTVGPRRALVTRVSITAAGKTDTAPATTTMTTGVSVFVTPRSAAERARVMKLLTQK